MAKKEEQVEVVAAEVVEDRVTKDIAQREDAAQRTVIKKTIARQVATVQGVELRSNFEKLKLGAMVSEAVRVLNLEDPSANRGRNAAGGGALGWWADVCPRDKDGKPVIAYRTVMKWKEAADNLAGHLRHIGPGKLEENIIKVLAKNPKKAVGKDTKILASAEKLANGMTMRQMLLWGDDEPAKGKGGRPKAKRTDFTMPPPEKVASDLWADLKGRLEQPALLDTIDSTPVKVAVTMIGVLNGLVSKLQRRVREA